MATAMPRPASPACQNRNSLQKDDFTAELPRPSDLSAPLHPGLFACPSATFVTLGDKTVRAARHPPTSRIPGDPAGRPNAGLPAPGPATSETARGLLAPHTRQPAEECGHKMARGVRESEWSAGAFVVVLAV